jgi:GT2 family glycosyltransferase
VIAIVLVNWNGRKDTIECLESLARLDDGDFIVLVVDNGSTDGSIESIEAWGAQSESMRPNGPPWPRLPEKRRWPVCLRRLDREGPINGFAPGTIAIVDTGENLGYAGGNNVGMKIARRDPRITHFWLLNNDTVVESDCLARLKETSANDPTAGFIGALLLYYDQPDVVQSVGGAAYLPYLGRASYIGHLAQRADLPSLQAVERRMTYVQGASIFLPVAVYDLVGPMSESYFLYYEEPDWAHRLPKTYHMTMAPDAVVYHKEGASIGSDTLSRASDISIYYSHANLFSYMWRWHRALFPVAYVRMLRDIYCYLRRGDTRAAGVTIRAMIDAHIRPHNLRRPVARPPNKK